MAFITAASYVVHWVAVIIEIHSTAANGTGTSIGQLENHRHLQNLNLPAVLRTICMYVLPPGWSRLPSALLL
ncbi:hypothetical protein GGR54DRAFT_582137 [Hypoxylon sp. NC1633]|nr:hypothetical protein GGR54DRAFT_582137 [Hypoxylon sp. NC1633]